MAKKSTGVPHWKSKDDIPINEELRNAICTKKRLHRQWISNYGHESTENRRKAYNKNQVKSMMRQVKRSFEHDIASNATKSPKRFWSFVRGKLKTRSGVFPLRKNINDKESLQFDDKIKADILQDQFASVFTREPNDGLPELNTRTNSTNYNICIISTMVEKKLLKLDVSKEVGPDEISSRLLNDIANHVSSSLALVFNYFPRDWKTAHISPIFKKGAREVASNYRPKSYKQCYTDNTNITA